MHLIRKTLVLTGRFIGNLIDFFYPPFRKYFSLQFFRYGVSGSLTLGFSLVSFFIIYQFVVQKRMVDLGVVTLSGHTATVILNFVLTVVVGFFLQKYVTFTASELRGQKQLLRYVEVATLNLIINYLGIKFLYEALGVYPSVANAIVAIFSTFISYILQKKYTFRIKNAPKE